MIVADTSALLAVVFGEPDHAGFAAALLDHRVSISAATLAEALIVVEARQGPDGAQDLRLLVAETVDDVLPVDQDHAVAAFAAWQRFGKGRHLAALNLGDCFSYATAKLAGAPLLFKGADFSQTDVSVVG